MTFEKLKDKLRGVAFTVATPFSEVQNEVCYEHLKDNVNFIDEKGGELFLPCGNTGEYYSLTDTERVNVVQATTEAVRRDNAVIGGVSGSIKTVISLAKRYQEAGADGILLMQPNHPYSHQEGLKQYYHTIADSVDCSIVIYKRRSSLSDKTLEDVIERENVIGVKYAVNDIKSFSSFVSNTSDDIVISNGIAERYAPSFVFEGAEGFTTGIGNFVPKPVLKLMNILHEENWHRAKQLRDDLMPYEDLREETGDNNSIVAANNIPAVKYGMDLAGLYGGPVRKPLVELSQTDKQRAEQYYKDIQDIKY